MTQPITNDAGQVALKYHQPARILAQNTPSGKEWFFEVKANISLAFVDSGDVDNLLQRRAGCNCGGSRKRQAFDYANESDVRRWENGGGR